MAHSNRHAAATAGRSRHWRQTAIHKPPPIKTASAESPYVPINRLAAISGVSASTTPIGFHEKPVNMVARSHSVIAQPPASASTRDSRFFSPNRQARPAAMAG